jgi:hypothetical protein
MIFTPADKRGAGAFDGSQRETDRKFADSPLEGTGFEISVPRQIGNGFVADASRMTGQLGVET